MSKGKIIAGVFKFLGKDEALRQANRLLNLDGGPGSGNFGHSGRPGKVGGSQKESGGSAFRSGSKETGYTSFAKTQAFKGIVSSARNSKDYNEFVKSMSETQRNALRDQRIACGTDENMSAYAKRVYAMLHEHSEVRDKRLKKLRQNNKPVDGKDISQTWTYQGEGEGGKFGKTRGSHAIDTDIEDVIHQQGFDGVPKIVSQAEFDKIVKNNPQMPILLRSYVGFDQAQLDQYDKDLEEGFFYVDCGTGGAGFGQGMYCAGCYGLKPKKWDSPEAKYRAGEIIQDNRGRNFKLGREFDKDLDGEKMPEPTDEGERYVFGKELPDGTIERRMIEAVDLEEYGMCWVDMNNGAIYDGDLGKEFDSFINLDEVTEEYANNARQKALEGAKGEMQHYRQLGVKRMMESVKPIVPEGKVKASGTDNEGEDHHYYFDEKDMKPFKSKKDGDVENMPEDRSFIAVGDPSEDHFKKYGATVYRVKGNYLITMDGQDMIRMEDLNVGESWSYLEGNCEMPKVDPKPTTRMMTLDPSAKIITYDELKRLKERSNLPKHLDDGVVAALYGYDAINAEGHGLSGSYTVVLNRTKVIISEEPVAV
jgi:hypothetical protein